MQSHRRKVLFEKGPSGDNSFQAAGSLAAPGRLGAMASFSVGPDGTKCINIGPHVNVTPIVTPVINLGAFGE